MDAHPFSHVTAILDKFRCARYLSILDLKYWQILANPISSRVLYYGLRRFKKNIIAIPSNAFRFAFGSSHFPTV